MLIPESGFTLLPCVDGMLTRGTGFIPHTQQQQQQYCLPLVGHLSTRLQDLCHHLLPLPLLQHQITEADKLLCLLVGCLLSKAVQIQ
jgi:hypothetical protein